MKTRNAGPYIVAMLVTGFLMFGVYLAAFVPKMDEGKNLDAQTAQATTLNQGLKARVDLVASKAKNLGELTEQIETFNKAFPVGASQKDLLTAITREAQAAGVTLTSLNPSVPAFSAPATQQAAPPAAGGDAALQSVQAQQPADGEAATAKNSILAVITLDINANGSLGDLRDFVARIESLERPVLIKEVTLTGSGSETALTITGESFLVAPLTDPAAKAEEDAAPAAPPAEG